MKLVYLDQRVLANNRVAALVTLVDTETPECVIVGGASSDLDGKQLSAAATAISSIASGVCVLPGKHDRSAYRRFRAGRSSGFEASHGNVNPTFESPNLLIYSLVLSGARGEGQECVSPMILAEMKAFFRRGNRSAVRLLAVTDVGPTGRNGGPLVNRRYAKLIEEAGEGNAELILFDGDLDVNPLQVQCCGGRGLVLILGTGNNPTIDHRNITAIEIVDDSIRVQNREISAEPHSTPNTDRVFARKRVGGP